MNGDRRLEPNPPHESTWNRRDFLRTAGATTLGALAAGEPERARRAVRMVYQMDGEGFGSCSNEGECEAVCPKSIPISNIARMTREYVKAMLSARD
jgi:succinate dehydrogenase / fumarate reductase iron-sulfur subunit